MSIPIIETERLRLRPLTAADSQDIFEYAQDELVAIPGMWEPFASFDECQAFVEKLIPQYKRDLVWWAIEHRSDQKVIGRVELSNWRRYERQAEISYALHRRYWNQGLMTEAAERIAMYGWDELKLHRLWAKVLPDNAASVRVLKKLGMEYEGRLRHHLFLREQWQDVEIYAVLR